MRHLILISVAIPVVTASIALADWARSEVSTYRSYRNHVAFDSTAFMLPMDRRSGTPSYRELTAACDQTASLWKPRLNADYNMIVRAPFVVAGDVPEAALERYHEQVILPTADVIDRVYTQSKPNEPILVLLFSREDEYRQHTHHLFSQANVSIYGYYNPATRTVGINLASGTGTLVHELTHALLDFDFPDMPLWLNEGIASLHEQAEIRGGAEAPRILGHINWRYPILRDAIQAGHLRSIQELLASDVGFRGSQEGVNYAHARYLCLYLQQQGKLVKFYEALRNDATHDPTGAVTLLGLFVGRSWNELERDFQQWVIHLE